MTRFVLLAAGAGTRLRPLTLHAPKTLTPLGNGDLLQQRLAHFAACGLYEGIIHINQRFETLLASRLKDPCFDAFKLTISTETTDTPLGTMPAIKKALATLAHHDAPILCASADIWTQLPLPQLPLPPQYMAHIVLVDNPEAYGGDFPWQKALMPFGSSAPCKTFSGLAWLHPQCLLNTQHKELGALLRTLHQRQQLQATYQPHPWYNINSLDDLIAVQRHLLHTT